MKKETAQKIEYECMRREARTPSFTRAFGQLEQPASTVPQGSIALQYGEQKEIILAHQLEAERKRAIGISYSRQYITR